jgi:hypothetical protein
MWTDNIIQYRNYTGTILFVKFCYNREEKKRQSFWENFYFQVVRNKQFLIVIRHKKLILQQFDKSMQPQSFFTKSL